ncbi:vWA domain-containing protein [Luteimonas arsenica]|uniref:vWA domain-containing protein n=1 Tax=Luteimonas arsenica TaxID=1586242 RepID=UPI0010548412|nr:VWA domain-containing protein [Luteimonas arsenica]
MSLAALWPTFAGFAWPWALLALPLPWLLRALLAPVRDAGPALRVPWGARLAEVAAAAPGARAALCGQPWLAWLGWCLLCLAAARPLAWGEAVQPPQTSRELMMAVDLSASMGERDMWMGQQLVDRLTAAKAVIADFLDRREGDRVGLLVFGRGAYVLAPATADLDTVRTQLLATEVAMVGRETSIGDAIGLGVKRLQAQRGGERVLVLLTDGVNTAGVLDPMKAAEIARDEGVRIHTIAFGGEGEDLSVFGFRLPSGGSDIDEEGLAAIAGMTGGRSFRARDVDALAGIYAEIDRIEPVEAPGEALRPRLERYPWPLALALLAGLLAAGLSLRRAGP